MEYLSRYRIDSVLGQGAMSVVYKAFDPLMERWVALKTQRKGSCPDKQQACLTALFQHEAQVAGRLGHPNIVKVLENGQDCGRAFIVMEFIDGLALRALMVPQIPTATATVMLWMSDLLTALSFAHECGVVHGDVKPSNLLVTRHARLKVSDFGIARSGFSTPPRCGTMSDTMTGTPAFMSPEQYHGDAVDGRSDLFSAGVLLYLLLTGARPFAGTPAIMLQQTPDRKPQPPSSVNPRLGRFYDHVAATALARQPAGRFTSAQEFLDELKSAHRSAEIGASQNIDPEVHRAILASQLDSIMAHLTAHMGHENNATGPAMPVDGSPPISASVISAVSSGSSGSSASADSSGNLITPDSLHRSHDSSGDGCPPASFATNSAEADFSTPPRQQTMAAAESPRHGCAGSPASSTEPDNATAGSLPGFGRHRLSIGLVCGLTDTGPVRTRNEDNFLIDETLNLAAVADGMGGHAAGDLASASALQALRDYLQCHRAEVAGLAARALAASHAACDLRIAPSTPDLTIHLPALTREDPDATWSDPAMPAIALLHDAIAAANEQLYQHNLDSGLGAGDSGGGMGTTLSGFWHPLRQGPLLLFHIGDSRIYRLRAGRLDQLTRDQTLYQQALEAGLAGSLPPRNLLLQAVGPAATLTPEIRTQMVVPGDVLMLCSDGLHGPVPDGASREVLARVASGELTPQSACSTLVTMAASYAGRDNVTVVIVVCESEPGAGHAG